LLRKVKVLVGRC